MWRRRWRRPGPLFWHSGKWSSFLYLFGVRRPFAIGSCRIPNRERQRALLRRFPIDQVKEDVCPLPVDSEWKNPLGLLEMAKATTTKGEVRHGFFFGGTLGKRASEHANALTENNTIGADQFLDNRQAPAFAGRWVPLDKIQFSRESSHLFLYFLLSPFFFLNPSLIPCLSPFFKISDKCQTGLLIRVKPPRALRLISTLNFNGNSFFPVFSVAD